MAFEKNPCRRTAFEAFRIDKSETNPLTINSTIRDAFNSLQNGNALIKERDGTDWQISQADLNKLKDIMLCPVERLGTEQFVHETHLFRKDTILDELLAKLDEPYDTRKFIESVLARLWPALIAVVPYPEPEPMEDDLPQPDLCEHFQVPVEPLDVTILRER